MGRVFARAFASHVAIGLGSIGVLGALTWRAFDRVCGELSAQAGATTARGSAAAAVLTDPYFVLELTATVILILLTSLLAASRLVAPLRRLRTAAATIRTGRYDVPLSEACRDDLGDLGNDLDSLRRELADIEDRRRRLLGEVAHEMRTPLTIIDGYVEGMIDGIIPTDADELGHVTDEVRRLRRLADDLSALSRAQEGRLDLRLLPADLRDVVTVAGERLRPQVEDAGLELRLMPGRLPLTVLVDQDRLSQVVRNLIGNAVRATPPGGSVTISLGRSDRWTWFVVRDTGEGIAPADLERIFERFYRVAGRRESRGETGSGIGLTIAREIIRAHGGELVARSMGLGSGAEFIVWLPQAASVAP